MTFVIVRPDGCHCSTLEAFPYLTGAFAHDKTGFGLKARNERIPGLLAFRFARNYLAIPGIA